MKVTMPLAVILGLVLDKPEDDKWEALSAGLRTLA
jgi:hypothetical protein